MFKRFILHIFVLAFILVSCKKEEPKTVTPALPNSPSITSFSPNSATTNDVVTISGANFTGATIVSFGGTLATSFIVDSPTSITSVVAEGKTGDISITTPIGVTTKSGFTFKPPGPSITSFIPLIATTNDIIVITGKNFIGVTMVSFGGTNAAKFFVENDTRITAWIGTGASGDVSITGPNGVSKKAGFDFVKLDYAACKISNTTFVLQQSSTGIGFPRRIDRVASKGTINIQLIFIDYKDAPATKTPQEVFTSLSPSAEDFLKGVSYGNLKVNFNPEFKWFRMSKTTTDYGWPIIKTAPLRDLCDEALALADGTVDFSNSDAFVIINPGSAVTINNSKTYGRPIGFGVKVDGKILNNGILIGDKINGLQMVQEMSHIFTLMDLWDLSDNKASRFTGDFDLMSTASGLAPEYFGWGRWVLGWINDDQVVCANNTGNSNMILTPIEQKDGMKLLIIPIDRFSAVVVESRRALGFDKLIPKEGPLVYVVDMGVPNGGGVIKILPIDNNDLKKLQKPLSVGQTITYDKISVKFVSTSASGDLIQYEKK